MLTIKGGDSIVDRIHEEVGDKYKAGVCYRRAARLVIVVAK
jgi:hypothetical protein